MANEIDRTVRKILDVNEVYVTGLSFQRALGRCGNERGADSSTETKREDKPKCKREEMNVLKLLAAGA